MTEPTKHTILPNGIEIEGWTITCDKGPILNDQQCEEYSTALDMGTLPEMVFGDSKVVLQHCSGTTISLNARDALQTCCGPEAVERAHKVQVAAAKQWNEREHARSDVQVLQQSFDWTYTTQYKGSLSKSSGSGSGSGSGGEVTVKAAPEGVGLDMAKLRARDPILYYEELVLFEDELADNGIAQLSVKIRVMPKLFLCLLRFWLRVDGVLVRVNDCRIYHEYGTPHVYREWQEREEEQLPFELKHPELQVGKMMDPSQAAPAMTMLKEEKDIICLK